MNVEYRNGSKIRYTPTNDYVFKKIFGKRGNEDITANLLKAITGKEYEKLNLEDTPILEREIIENKMEVLDVKIVADKVDNIDIEIQVAKSEYIADRILWYWSKMYSMSIEKGLTYDNTKKATCILIADFKLDRLKEIPKFRTKWNIREEEYKEVILTNKLEIVIIELEKLEENEVSKEDKELLNWCRFIKNPENVEDTIMEENNSIKKAKEELEKINSNEHERRIAELREKAILDELALRKSGFNEGKREGIEEGKKENSKIIAKKLLEKGLSIEEIIDVTELTKEEINKLKNS